MITGLFRPNGLESQHHLLNLDFKSPYLVFHVHR
jgi:hypothetical protein